MAGKPKVRSLDSGRKEITAIISKKGRNCQFDADPIKGRFDFVPGDQVNYSNWKFKPIIQLESGNAFKHDIATQDALIVNNHAGSDYSKEAKEFAQSNFFINKDDSSKKLKDGCITHTINILQTLIHEGRKPTQMPLMPADPGGIANISTTDGSHRIGGYSPHEIFDFSSGFLQDFQLYINDPTYFEGQNIKNGMKSFNFQWKGVVVSRL